MYIVGAFIRAVPDAGATYYIVWGQKILHFYTLDKVVRPFYPHLYTTYPIRKSFMSMGPEEYQMDDYVIIYILENDKYASESCSAS